MSATALVLLLGVAKPVATPVPQPSVPALSSLQPIDIDADLLELDGKEDRCLQGNVEARQGDVTIRAERVEAAYSKQASGIVRAIAEGQVTVTSGAKVGRAERAEFNNEQRTVVLSGEPRLWEEGSVLEGREIVFHVDSGRVECFECSIDVDPKRVKEMTDEQKKRP